MTKSNVQASLVARFKAALAIKGLTVTSWARNRGRHAPEVWMTLSGARPYPEIRDEIAAFLGISREALDAEIDGAASAPAGEAA